MNQGLKNASGSTAILQRLFGKAGMAGANADINRDGRLDHQELAGLVRANHEKFNRLLQKEARTLQSRFKALSLGGEDVQEILLGNPREESDKLVAKGEALQLTIGRGGTARQFLEAKWHYKLALFIDPENDRAHYRLAELRLMKGREEEAFFHLAQAIRFQRNPGLHQDILHSIQKYAHGKRDSWIWVGGELVRNGRDAEAAIVYRQGAEDVGSSHPGLAAKYSEKAALAEERIHPPEIQISGAKLTSLIIELRSLGIPLASYTESGRVTAKSLFKGLNQTWEDPRVQKAILVSGIIPKEWIRKGKFSKQILQDFKATGFGKSLAEYYFTASTQTEDPKLKKKNLKLAYWADPKEILVLKALGELYFQENNFRKAAQFYGKARRLDRNDPEIKDAFGEASFLAGKFEWAFSVKQFEPARVEAAFQERLAQLPVLILEGRLGEAETLREQTSQALQIYQKNHAEKYPTHDAHRIALLLYGDDIEIAKGNMENGVNGYQKRLAYLEKMIKAGGTQEYQYLLLRAKIHYSLGDYSLALEDYDKAVERAPSLEAKNEVSLLSEEYVASLEAAYQEIRSQRILAEATEPKNFEEIKEAVNQEIALASSLKKHLERIPLGRDFATDPLESAAIEKLAALQGEFETLEGKRSEYGQKAGEASVKLQLQGFADAGYLAELPADPDLSRFFRLKVSAAFKFELEFLPAYQELSYEEKLTLLSAVTSLGLASQARSLRDGAKTPELHRGFYDWQASLLSGRPEEAQLKLRAFKQKIGEALRQDPSLLKADPELEGMLLLTRQTLQEFGLQALDQLEAENAAIGASREGSALFKRRLEEEFIPQYLAVLKRYIRQGKADTVEEAVAMMEADHEKMIDNFLQRPVEKGEHILVDSFIRKTKERNPETETHRSYRKIADEYIPAFLENPEATDPRVKTVHLNGGAVQYLSLDVGFVQDAAVRVEIGREGGIVKLGINKSPYVFPPLKDGEPDRSRIVVLYEDAIWLNHVKSGKDYSQKTGLLNLMYGIDGAQMLFYYRQEHEVYHRFFGGPNQWGEIQELDSDPGFKAFFESHTKAGLERMLDPEARGLYSLEIADTLRGEGSYDLAGSIYFDLYRAPLEAAKNEIPHDEKEEIRSKIEAKRQKRIAEKGKILDNLKENFPEVYQAVYPQGDPSDEQIAEEVNKEIEAEIEEKIIRRALPILDRWAGQKGDENPLRADPIALAAWQKYEGMLDPLNKWNNLADATSDSINQEIFITAVTLPMTMGVGSLARGAIRGIPLMARMAAQGGWRLWVARGVVFAGGAAAETYTNLKLTGQDVTLKNFGLGMVMMTTFHGGGAAWGKIANGLGIGEKAIQLALREGRSALALKALNFTGTMLTQTTVGVAMSEAASWIPGHETGLSLEESALLHGAQNFGFHYGTKTFHWATRGKIMEFENRGRLRWKIAHDEFKRLGANNDKLSPANRASREKILSMAMAHAKGKVPSLVSGKPSATIQFFHELGLQIPAKTKLVEKLGIDPLSADGKLLDRALMIAVARGEKVHDIEARLAKKTPASLEETLREVLKLDPESKAGKQTKALLARVLANNSKNTTFAAQFPELARQVEEMRAPLKRWLRSSELDPRTPEYQKAEVDLLVAVLVDGLDPAKLNSRPTKSISESEIEDALKVLGLTRQDLNQRTLKAKYRELSRQYHPDHNSNLSGEQKRNVEEKTIEINLAHDLLATYLSKSGDNKSADQTISTQTDYVTREKPGAARGAGAQRIADRPIIREAQDKTRKLGRATQATESSQKITNAIESFVLDLEAMLAKGLAWEVRPPTASDLVTSTDRILERYSYSKGGETLGWSQERIDLENFANLSSHPLGKLAQATKRAIVESYALRSKIAELESRAPKSPDLATAKQALAAKIESIQEWERTKSERDYSFGMAKNAIPSVAGQFLLLRESIELPTIHRDQVWEPGVPFKHEVRATIQGPPSPMNNVLERIVDVETTVPPGEYEMAIAHYSKQPTILAGEMTIYVKQLSDIQAVEAAVLQSIEADHPYAQRRVVRRMAVAVLKDVLRKQEAQLDASAIWHPFDAVATEVLLKFPDGQAIDSPQLEGAVREIVTRSLQGASLQVDAAVEKILEKRLRQAPQPSRLREAGYGEGRISLEIPGHPGMELQIKIVLHKAVPKNKLEQIAQMKEGEIALDLGGSALPLTFGKFTIFRTIAAKQLATGGDGLFILSSTGQAAQPFKINYKGKAEIKILTAEGQVKSFPAFVEGKPLPTESFKPGDILVINGKPIPILGPKEAAQELQVRNDIKTEREQIQKLEAHVRELQAKLRTEQKSENKLRLQGEIKQARETLQAARDTFEVSLFDKKRNADGSTFRENPPKLGFARFKPISEVGAKADKIERGKPNEARKARFERHYFEKEKAERLKGLSGDTLKKEEAALRAEAKAVAEVWANQVIADARDYQSGRTHIYDTSLPADPKTFQAKPEYAHLDKATVDHHGRFANPKNSTEQLIDRFEITLEAVKNDKDLLAEAKKDPAAMQAARLGFVKVGRIPTEAELVQVAAALKEMNLKEATTDNLADGAWSVWIAQNQARVLADPVLRETIKHATHFEDFSAFGTEYLKEPPTIANAEGKHLPNPKYEAIQLQAALFSKYGEILRDAKVIGSDRFNPLQSEIVMDRALKVIDQMVGHPAQAKAEAKKFFERVEKAREIALKGVQEAKQAGKGDLIEGASVHEGNINLSVFDLGRLNDFTIFEQWLALPMVEAQGGSPHTLQMSVVKMGTAEGTKPDGTKVKVQKYLEIVAIPHGRNLPSEQGLNKDALAAINRAELAKAEALGLVPKEGETPQPGQLPRENFAKLWFGKENVILPDPAKGGSLLSPKEVSDILTDRAPGSQAKPLKLFTPKPDADVITWRAEGEGSLLSHEGLEFLRAEDELWIRAEQGDRAVKIGNGPSTMVRGQAISVESGTILEIEGERYEVRPEGLKKLPKPAPTQAVPAKVAPAPVPAAPPAAPKLPPPEAAAIQWRESLFQGYEKMLGDYAQYLESQGLPGMRVKISPENQLADGRRYIKYELVTQGDNPRTVLQVERVVDVRTKSVDFFFHEVSKEFRGKKPNLGNKSIGELFFAEWEPKLMKAQGVAFVRAHFINPKAGEHFRSAYADRGRVGWERDAEIGWVDTAQKGKVETRDDLDGIKNLPYKNETLAFRLSREWAQEGATLNGEPVPEGVRAEARAYVKSYLDAAETQKSSPQDPSYLGPFKFAAERENGEAVSILSEAAKPAQGDGPWEVKLSYGEKAGMEIVLLRNAQGTESRIRVPRDHPFQAGDKVFLAKREQAVLQADFAAAEAVVKNHGQKVEFPILPERVQTLMDGMSTSYGMQDYEIQGLKPDISGELRLVREVGPEKLEKVLQAPGDHVQANLNSLLKQAEFDPVLRNYLTKASEQELILLAQQPFGNPVKLLAETSFRKILTEPSLKDPQRREKAIRDYIDGKKRKPLEGYAFVPLAGDRFKITTAGRERNVEVRLDSALSEQYFYGDRAANLESAFSFISLDKVYTDAQGNQLRFTGEVLGQGSSATVFVAERVTAEGKSEKVAVKVRTHGSASAAENKAQAERDLTHINFLSSIDPAYAVGGAFAVENATPALVMPLFEPGKSLFFTTLDKIPPDQRAIAEPQVEAIILDFAAHGHRFGDVEFVLNGGKVHLVDIEGMLLKGERQDPHRYFSLETDLRLMGNQSGIRQERLERLVDGLAKADPQVLEANGLNLTDPNQALFLGHKVSPKFAAIQKLAQVYGVATVGMPFETAWQSLAVAINNLWRARADINVPGFAKKGRDAGHAHAVDRHFRPERHFDPNWRPAPGEVKAGNYKIEIDVESLHMKTISDWDRVSISYDSEGRMIFMLQKDFPGPIGKTTVDKETRTNQVILNADGEIHTGMPVKPGERGWVSKQEIQNSGKSFDQLVVENFRKPVDVEAQKNEYRYAPFLSQNAASYPTSEGNETRYYLDQKIPYEVINGRTRAAYQEGKIGFEQVAVTTKEKKGLNSVVQGYVVEMKFEEPIGKKKVQKPDGSIVEVELYWNRTYLNNKGEIVGGYPIAEKGEPYLEERLWNQAFREAPGKKAEEAPKVAGKKQEPGQKMERIKDAASSSALHPLEGLPAEAPPPAPNHPGPRVTLLSAVIALPGMENLLGLGNQGLQQGITAALGLGMVWWGIGRIGESFDRNNPEKLLRRAVSAKSNPGERKRALERLQVLADKYPAEPFQGQVVESLLNFAMQGEAWALPMVKSLLNKDHPELISRLAEQVEHEGPNIQQRAFYFLLNLKGDKATHLLRRGVESAIRRFEAKKNSLQGDPYRSAELTQGEQLIREMQIGFNLRVLRNSSKVGNTLFGDYLSMTAWVNRNNGLIEFIQKHKPQTPETFGVAMWVEINTATIQTVNLDEIRTPKKLRLMIEALIGSKLRNEGMLDPM